jgi:ribonuclease BN (tRNA processing enzyme)
MQLQFVGCGDAFGSGGRFNTCFHLVGRKHQRAHRLRRDLARFDEQARRSIRNDIGTIFLTHFHADHVGGVPFFLLEANYVLKRERRSPSSDRRVSNRATPESWRRLSRHEGSRLQFPLHAAELEIGKRTEDRRLAGHGVSRRARRSRRTLPRISLRSRRQDVIAYSGDTEWTDTLIDIGYEADLFICEAYTRDKPIATHMALSSLERHLDQIRPKRLILTHMSRRHAGAPRRSPVRNRRGRDDRRAVSGAKS